MTTEREEALREIVWDNLPDKIRQGPGGLLNSIMDCCEAMLKDDRLARAQPQGEPDFIVYEIEHTEHVSSNWFSLDPLHPAGKAIRAIKLYTSPLEQAIPDPFADKYHELLMAVASKYPNESRHETALRYIRQAEEGGGAMCPDAARSEKPIG